MEFIQTGRKVLMKKRVKKVTSHLGEVKKIKFDVEIKKMFFQIPIKTSNGNRLIETYYK